MLFILIKASFLRETRLCTMIDADYGFRGLELHVSWVKFQHLYIYLQ